MDIGDSLYDVDDACGILILTPCTMCVCVFVCCARTYYIPIDFNLNDPNQLGILKVGPIKIFTYYAQVEFVHC